MLETAVQTEYTIRRKVFTLAGAKFHIYDANDNLIGFSRQKAFKLKEDIEVFSDESMTSSLLSIKARSIIDFSAAYDVTESQSGTKIGTLRRKGLTSIVRDAWEVLDADDHPISQISEDSVGLALIRRFIPLGSLIPQKYHIGDENTPMAEYRTHFNPFVHKTTVTVYPGRPIHPMLVLAGGVLLVAIEGRQEQ